MMAAQLFKEEIFLCLAVFFFIPSFSSWGAVFEAVKIMPLGDSLTDGFIVPGGYRTELWTRIQSGGYLVDFVGTRSGGPDSLGDKDHEGYPGRLIEDVAAGVNNSLQTYRPDIVLLMIGVNDMIQNRDVGAAPARLSALIDQIIAQVPETVVLVATLPPVADSEVNQRILQFNASIPEMVQSKFSRGDWVYLADLHDRVEISDLADGVHPNAAGYARLGQGWYQSLLDLNLFDTWQSGDIGTVGVAGSSNESSGGITIAGSGADIWNQSDNFHYRSIPLRGDGAIVARIGGIQPTNTLAKAGIMIRETLSERSKNVSIFLISGKGNAFQFRTKPGANTVSTAVPPGIFDWLKLVREGSTFTGYISTSGDQEIWTKIGSVSLDMSTHVRIGLAVSSRDNRILANAAFSTVAIDRTAPLLGRIVREFWNGIGGTGVSSIPLATSPSGMNRLTGLEASPDWGDSYGSRIRGYLTPPITGRYTFWIAGDDNCELWFSPDADPGGKKRIAYVNGWTEIRDWTRYSSQHAVSRSLVAGTRYYLEVLQKEDHQADHVEVAWQGPKLARSIVSDSFVIPYPQDLGQRLVPLGRFGSPPSQTNVASTYDQATDGNTETFFDSLSASTGFTGIDVGSEKRIKTIRYFPRDKYENRMVGGKFQGALLSTGPWSNLYLVKSRPVPGNWVSVPSLDTDRSFRYLRYFGPAGAHANIAEFEFYEP